MTAVDHARLRELVEAAVAADDGIAPDLYRELPPVIELLSAAPAAKEAGE